MELNSIPRFHSVDERSFDSIYRRGLVVFYRSQFRNPKWLAKNLPNHRELGVFPRDAKLRTFLRSGPACAATLTLLRGFLYEKTAEECLDLLEEYVERGGDGGITRKTLRLACGLSEEQTGEGAEGCMSDLLQRATKREPGTTQEACVAGATAGRGQRPLRPAR